MVGAVTPGFAAVHIVISLQWDQKNLLKLVQKMCSRDEGSEPRLPNTMAET